MWPGCFSPSASRDKLDCLRSSASHMKSDCACNENELDCAEQICKHDMTSRVNELTFDSWSVKSERIPTHPKTIAWTSMNASQWNPFQKTRSTLPGIIGSGKQPVYPLDPRNQFSTSTSMDVIPDPPKGTESPSVPNESEYTSLKPS